MKLRAFLFTLISLLTLPAFSQTGPGGSNYPLTGAYVLTAPSGTCTGQTIEYVLVAGTVYTCQAGTWAELGGGGASGTVTAVVAGAGLAGGTITHTGTISLGDPNSQTITAQATAIAIPDNRDLHVYLNYTPTGASFNALPDGTVDGQMLFVSAAPADGSAAHTWNLDVPDGDNFSGVHIDGTAAAPPLGVTLMWIGGAWTAVDAPATTTFN